MNHRTLKTVAAHSLALLGIAAMASCGTGGSSSSSGGLSPKPGGQPFASGARVSKPAGKTAKSAIKPCLAPCGSDGQALAFDKAWANFKLRWKKPVLNVQFLEGSPQLQARVLKIAGQWTTPSGETFQPVSEGGDIRIAFHPDGGHWSQIGIYAQQIYRKDPTMNLEVSDSTSDDELQRVVLHEFGHALGLFHEHLRPDAPLVWNEEAVYHYYEDYPNFWNRSQIKEQILDPQPLVDGAVRTRYDPRSIMHYPIPNELLKKGKPVDWNRSLTAYDRKLVAYLYNKEG